MPNRTLLPAAALAALLVSVAAPASAQIYVWRDAAGNLVLSDKARDPAAVTYAVPSGAPFRATRPPGRRAAAFESLIAEQAARHAVDADLVRAVIQAESAFNPAARSHKGAMGLMQLMPGTAAELGVTDPYDPAENIRGGVMYLRRLLDRYEGNVELALAAYNAGPGAVEKYGQAVPPYRETRQYVARVQGTLAAAGTAEPSGPPTRVYRLVEIIDGREVVRYSGRPREGSERVTAAERR